VTRRGPRAGHTYMRGSPGTWETSVFPLHESGSVLPVTKDQATRRAELSRRVERKNQFGRGTVAQVHRGWAEEGGGVGVLYSTKESGEVAPGDPGKGREDQQPRASGGIDGRNFESAPRLNHTSLDSDYGAAKLRC
jgi:hypothetical protein